MARSRSSVVARVLWTALVAMIASAWVPAWGQSATATVSPTPTATPKPGPHGPIPPSPTPTPIPAPVYVDLGRGVGLPGGIACVGATLSASGAVVVGTSNGIGFDPSVFQVNACTIDPGIGPGTAADKQLAYGSLGPGRERAAVFGFNLNPIPNGRLFSCEFGIDADAPLRSYPLSNIAGASDPFGNDLPATGAEGEILVTACTGDCNGDGVPTIGDIIRAVNIFLGRSLCSCPVADADGNGVVSIGEIIQTVNRFLYGCPAEATPTPTDTPTSTPTFSGTDTPTLTPTPTPTPTGVIGGFCGDGVVDPGETCDDGGACFGGPNEGLACTSQDECPGGTCAGYGGDGCSKICNNESVVRFEYSGAICVGGARDGYACSFVATCVGGSKPGRPCATNSECAGGTCVSECGADSQGCFADGECRSGTNVGGPCLLTNIGQTVIGQNCIGGSNAGQECVDDSECPGGGTCGKTCQGGSKDGQGCTFDFQCSGGGTCGRNPCGAGGSCLPRSRAALESVFSVVNIGPLIGYQDVHISEPDVDGIIYTAVPSDASTFDKIKVPGTLCACVRGTSDPGAHGPGNTSSGMIACGAATFANDVILAQDHNTSTPGVCLGGPNKGAPCTSDTDCGGANCNALKPQVGGLDQGNGPGHCVGGVSAGRACMLDTQCQGGGTCEGKGTGGGFCMGAPRYCDGGTSDGAACFNNAECPGGACSGTGNFLGFCRADAECPGSLCNSPDDANCTAVDPPRPEGSGDDACLEVKETCFTGPRVGAACTADADCGEDAVCATACNQNVLPEHVGVCNSPTHLQITGSGHGLGSALILSTTAIGAIDDGGSCVLAAACVGGTNDGSLCVMDADCPGGVCATAVCRGLCLGGSVPGTPCATDADCPGGTCDNSGANFGLPCLTPGDVECPGGTCSGIDPAKGLDGIPCTDDDPQTSRGVAQTIPQTTGAAAAFIADADIIAGAQLVHKRCTGSRGAVCLTKLVGTPFDCDALMADPPSTGAARLAVEFTALDQMINDSAVSIFLQARR